MKAVYREWMGSDTGGWMACSVLLEVVERTVQSQGLLLYGGFNVFNEGDIVLALSPKLMTLFAVFLASNVMVSGLLWLCYAPTPKQCDELSFKLTIFGFGEIADLVLWDEYSRASIEVLVYRHRQSLLHRRYHSKMLSIANDRGQKKLHSHLAVQCGDTGTHRRVFYGELFLMEYRAEN